MSASELSVTPGWSQTGSATRSCCARGPLPCFASTKVSWPSSSSAERIWRVTTACPLANHLLTSPMRMAPRYAASISAVARSTASVPVG